jgi:hypothetical protein
MRENPGRRLVRRSRELLIKLSLGATKGLRSFMDTDNRLVVL